MALQIAYDVSMKVHIYRFIFTNFVSLFNSFIIGTKFEMVGYNVTASCDRFAPRGNQYEYTDWAQAGFENMKICTNVIFVRTIIEK